MHHLQILTSQWPYARNCCYQQQQNLPYLTVSFHNGYYWRNISGEGSVGYPQEVAVVSSRHTVLKCL
jgi:hypothetical protein